MNAVCPGPIEVEKFLHIPVYDPAALAREIPAGRVVKPDDISGMVAFLCSDEAPHGSQDKLLTSTAALWPDCRYMQAGRFRDHNEDAGNRQTKRLVISMRGSRHASRLGKKNC
jgi:Enoyl-(Acyl carrier protein) reductase